MPRASSTRTCARRTLLRRPKARRSFSMSDSHDGRADTTYGSAPAVLRSVAATLDARNEATELHELTPAAGAHRGAAIAWIVAALILSGIGALVWMAMRVQ